MRQFETKFYVSLVIQIQKIIVIRKKIRRRLSKIINLKKKKNWESMLLYKNMLVYIALIIMEVLKNYKEINS